MRFPICYSLLLVLGLLAACRATHETTLLAINDVYEITPLANGTTGGMARVATVHRALKAQNPDTYFLHAGDFVSPSVLGTLRYEGKRIAGRQMVEVMNAAGVDYATFGNHEFDIDEADLQARLNESAFPWVVANLQHQTPGGPEPFYQLRQGQRQPLAKSVVLQTAKAKIGLLAVCIPVDKPYAVFDDVYAAAAREYERLVPQTDFVIALTHLEIEQDMELARRLPGLKLIVGGHDHENMRHQVGQVPICKADANAKTVYVHRLRFSPRSRQVKVRSQLRAIGPGLPDEPQTAQVVQKWVQIANQSFAEQGFDPNQVVYRTAEPWDGLEKSVRNRPTNLTDAIGKAFLAASPGVDAVVYNSGSIRVDDKLSGNITQYDVVRILPFGGAIVKVSLTGELLRQVLDAGQRNQGKGGYLQTQGLAQAPGGWLVNGQPLDLARTYIIATTDFLLTGKEFNMGFFTANHPGVQRVEPPSGPTDPRADVRKALIAYLVGR
jgi:2',3'-cyclic-nucleotide 2'-phosphodiesterase (5'-nucleotidase family)